MVISVFNEEAVIRQKIENALSLNYPGHLLEVIVSSDGSNDNTHVIVSSFKDPRVVLKKFDRIGKTGCLNRVVPEAAGEIVLFTDANSIFPPDLLANLCGNFRDPSVGMVTGWTQYFKAGGSKEITGIYAKLEKMTKYWESRVSSCVGADGAVFAIRKSLYRSLESHDINDLVIPLRVIEQSKRAVLDPRLFCREEASVSAKEAFRRQVRITTRTLWAIRCNPQFLNFVRYGSFSFFLLSHKVLRLAVPFFFVAAFAMSLSLLGRWWLYNTVFAAYMVFLGIGLFGFFGGATGRITSVCKFFLITFGAQFMGWIRMAAGVRDTTWTPRR